MRDESFFEKNLKVGNLFYVVFNRDHLLKTGVNVLEEQGFCHALVKDSSKKNETPIFRDISRFSRRCIRNLKPFEDKIDVLPKSEHTVQGNIYKI